MRPVSRSDRVLAGRIQDGVSLAQQAWDGAWGADTEYGSHGQHLIALGFGQLYLGELEAARLIGGEAMRVCRERSETTPLLFFLDLAGWTALLAGDVAAAASYFDEAREIATDLAIAASVRASLAGAVVASAHLGDTEATSRLWQRIEDVPVAPGPRADFEVGVAEAWTVAATGDPTRAAELLRSTADGAARRGLSTLQLLALLDVARLGYASTADAERAHETASGCQGSLVGVVASAIAGVASGDGRRLHDDAVRLGELGFVLWAAEFAARAADCLSSSGDQRAATAAQRLSDRCRLRIPAVRTPLLARALGLEPLTRREREIAGRATSGATNAEIADQLHVSVRTVETHLQRVYRKLGVSSRHELRDVLDS